MSDEEIIRNAAVNYHNIKHNNLKKTIRNAKRIIRWINKADHELNELLGVLDD